MCSCLALVDVLPYFPYARNAYIMVGIKGYGYCAAAQRAISLIISNALRLAAVNIVGDFLIILGKLCVCAACGVLAFLMTELE